MVNKYLPLFMLLGVSVGSALGLISGVIFFKENIGIGLAIGVPVGVAVGLLFGIVYGNNKSKK